MVLMFEFGLISRFPTRIPIQRTTFPLSAKVIWNSRFHECFYTSMLKFKGKIPFRLGLILRSLIIYKLYGLMEIKKTTFKERTLEYFIQNLFRFACVFRRIFRWLLVRFFVLFWMLYFSFEYKKTRIVTDFRRITRSGTSWTRSYC